MQGEVEEEGTTNFGVNQVGKFCQNQKCENWINFRSKHTNFGVNRVWIKYQVVRVEFDQNMEKVKIESTSGANQARKGENLKCRASMFFLGFSPCAFLEQVLSLIPFQRKSSFLKTEHEIPGTSELNQLLEQTKQEKGESLKCKHVLFLASLSLCIPGASFISHSIWQQLQLGIQTRVDFDQN